MDFFQQQENARRQTGTLVFYFALGFVGLVASLYVVLVLVATAGSDPKDGLALSLLPRSTLDWEFLSGVTAATAAIVGAGSLYKTAQLSQGGESVALMMGGRPVNIDTRDPAERKLLNVVEEMAIAAGVPVPPVYVMENETGINAFAAGFRPTNAVIGVTRGTVDKLTRDELQGVMAHEFSHILNGDMRLNMRLAGLIHGILVISVIGYYIVRAVGRGGRSSGSSDSKKGGGVVAFLLFGLALWILGSIGVFFGQLIRAAVSRQREYLADASAVQFTRNPEGIAGALKKIAAWSQGSRVTDAHAPEMSHLFFASAVAQMFATHPPLNDRIKRLDVHWDGALPDVTSPVPIEPPRKKEPRPAIPIPGVLGRDVLMEKVGGPQMQNILQAAVILDSLSEPVAEAVHETFSAQALLFAILLHEDPQVRARQLDRLQRELSPVIFEATLRLSPDVDRLPETSRLPTVELALPSLRQLSREQYIHFRDSVFNLVTADKRITVFEYVLQVFVIRCLDEQFQLRPLKRAKLKEPSQILGDLREVLSMLAHAGHNDAGQAKGAFAAGWKVLAPEDPARIMGRGDCTLGNFGQSLERLAGSVADLKKQILTACVDVIVFDRTVSLREYELIRAIGSVLDTPLPPISVGDLAEG
jgi:Zn-dependent protease with chaperone function